MKTNIIKLIVLLLALAGGFSSCLNKTKPEESKAFIVSRHFDTALQDSAMIHGEVLSLDGERPFAGCVEINDTMKCSFIDWIISIKGTDISTRCDSTGYFSIKLLPGTYTVDCIYPGERDASVLLKNLTLLPNEKVRVKFFIKGILSF
ncbi:MAG: carboxypeptidase-like regulatory domain-containing protein [Bacteroidales bacterium]|nr:carboxypeptidase-like regulatory domain-containing protein [Bacteroidales bacterium]